MLRLLACSALLSVATSAQAARIDIDAVQASSTYPDEGGISYQAAQVQDGKVSTAWVEGEEGSVTRRLWYPDISVEVDDGDDYAYHGRPYVTVVAYGDNGQKYGRRYRFVEDVDDLEGVFVDLFAEISASKHVVRGPVSGSVAVGGSTFYPQVDGNASGIANVTGPDGEIYNVNDPEAAGGFSYSLSVTDGTTINMTALQYDCQQFVRTDEVYVNESTNEEYHGARCTEIDSSTRTEISPDEVSMYTDGDDAGGLVDDSGAWWQPDLRNDTLAPYLDGDEFELESNEAIVVFDYPDSGDVQNRQIVLFRLGRSASEISADRFVDLTVSQVELSGA